MTQTPDPLFVFQGDQFLYVQIYFLEEVYYIVYQSSLFNFLR